MGRAKRQGRSDEAPGAPEWMVTFSDCMTLLLTFFVLLLSFSSFDTRVFHKLKVIFCESLPSVDPKLRWDKDAFLPPKRIQQPLVELDKGSEKSTLASGIEDRLKKETEPQDFRSRRVFLISSKKIFWGKGTTISFEGRNKLAKMASFLREVPSRMVISENGPGDDEGNEQLGLPRAWAAMEYLTTRQGLDKRRLSLSASSIATQESLEGNEASPAETEAERVLEIVLLERSIYN